MTMRSEKKLGVGDAMRATSPAPDAPAGEWPRCPRDAAVAARGDVASREQRTSSAAGPAPRRRRRAARRLGRRGRRDGARRFVAAPLRAQRQGRREARAECGARDDPLPRGQRGGARARRRRVAEALADSLGGLLRQDVQRARLAARRAAAGGARRPLQGARARARRAHSAREVADYINFCKESRSSRATARRGGRGHAEDDHRDRHEGLSLVRLRPRFLNALGKAEKVGEPRRAAAARLAVVVNAPAIMSMLSGSPSAILRGSDARRCGRAREPRPQMRGVHTHRHLGVGADVQNRVGGRAAGRRGAARRV